MKNNVDQNLKLKELAEHASFSVSHYSTLFKKKTGFAPIEYFIHLKIQRACQYLDLTSLHVYEIAETLGYTDPHYFSRLFQNIMGVSPTKFRKEKRGHQIEKT
ncbi:MAG: AraC family transcriptional regulator [Bacteroidetes bacterium]|jgi:YesN/AraC family two-component response regulator|nr:AraC family transcriptional regulator [Bacteroidota bacterium]